MIPLFITSFLAIRKRMKPKHWKFLHLASYPAYALLFAHVIYITLMPMKIVYSLLAITYFGLKLYKDGFKKLASPKIQLAALVFLAV